ncbi:MAG: IS6 family transposase [Chloroflexota bacterium]|nr:IS6 family transposase [Chloroflexota bacterium]
MAKYTQTTSVSLNCPACSSERVVKDGTRNGYQRYLCRECNKRFNTSGKTANRRFPPEVTGAAVRMFYSGMSYKRIAEHIEDLYDVKEPSKATIYEWVRDYTREAVDEMEAHPAHTSGHWVADEMVVWVGGEKYWNWNVMDSETRYILASHLSKRRDTRAANAVMRKAKAAAADSPKSIKTDKWRAYRSAIGNVFPDAKHVKSEGLAAELNNNQSERLQGTFRQRTKTLRGLDTQASGQLYLDGWTLDYNLFRKHEALKNRTPAQAARVDAPYSEWEDVVEHAAPYKRAKVETVLIGDIRAEYQLDVSVKEGALDDLPTVERKPAKPKHQSKAMAVKSNVPKVKSAAKTVRRHPYLTRSEAGRR